MGRWTQTTLQAGTRGAEYSHPPQNHFISGAFQIDCALGLCFAHTSTAANKCYWKDPMPKNVALEGRHGTHKNECGKRPLKLKKHSRKDLCPKTSFWTVGAEHTKTNSKNNLNTNRALGKIPGQKRGFGRPARNTQKRIRKW